MVVWLMPCERQYAVARASTSHASHSTARAACHNQFSANLLAIRYCVEMYTQEPVVVLNTYVYTSQISCAFPAWSKPPHWGLNTQWHTKTQKDEPPCEAASTGLPATNAYVISRMGHAMVKGQSNAEQA